MRNRLYSLRFFLDPAFSLCAICIENIDLSLLASFPSEPPNNLGAEKTRQAML